MTEEVSTEWRPAKVEEVARIVQEDLAICDDAQICAFRLYAVVPYHAPIIRYGRSERVIVVARRKSEVIYWEDVEEGFNVSLLGSDGEILDPWCNQDRLGLALNAWIEGRGRRAPIGAAIPIE